MLKIHSLPPPPPPICHYYLRGFILFLPVSSPSQGTTPFLEGYFRGQCSLACIKYCWIFGSDILMLCKDISEVAAGLGQLLLVLISADVCPCLTAGTVECHGLIIPHKLWLDQAKFCLCKLICYKEWYQPLRRWYLPDQKPSMVGKDLLLLQSSDFQFSHLEIKGLGQSGFWALLPKGCTSPWIILLLRVPTGTTPLRSFRTSWSTKVWMRLVPHAKV